MNRSQSSKQHPKQHLTSKSSDATTLLAGTAKCDITTDDPAAAVNDRLLAKVLVLDDGVTQLALISMDAVAIGGICDIQDDFLPELRQRVEQELKIKANHVVVHATHTHPPGRLLCEDDQLLDRTFSAIKQAMQNKVPVIIGTGCGHEDRILINRTLRLKNGQHWTIRRSNPCPPDDEVQSLGPLDPEIGILRIDRADGTPLAVVYNYACHPLVGMPGCPITANYPGFASKVIEESLGHDAMALFLQGAAGDVTEILWKEDHRPRDSQSIGTMLGLSTLSALKKIKTGKNGGTGEGGGTGGTGGGMLHIRCETVDFPRRNDIPLRIEQLLQEQTALLASLRFTSLNFKAFLPLYIQHAISPDEPSDYRYRYLHAKQIGSDDLDLMDTENKQNLDKYLSNIKVMEKLARIEDKIATLKRHLAINDQSGQTTLPAQITGIKIGDFVCIAAPVEILTQVSLNVKKASPHKHTFIAGFTNGYMHYGPPADDYDKGGYEVTECLLAPAWQKIFEDIASEILSQL